MDTTFYTLLPLFCLFPFFFLLHLCLPSTLLPTPFLPLEIHSKIKNSWPVLMPFPLAVGAMCSACRSSPVLSLGETLSTAPAGISTRLWEDQYYIPESDRGNVHQDSLWEQALDWGMHVVTDDSRARNVAVCAPIKAVISLRHSSTSAQRHLLPDESRASSEWSEHKSPPVCTHRALQPGRGGRRGKRTWTKQNSRI